MTAVYCPDRAAQARVAKPVDARDLKSLGLRPVRVRVPPRVLHLLGCLLLGSQPLPAQQRIAPFETVGVSLSLLSNVNRNSFHDVWRSGTGAELSLSSPFYAGTVEAGLDQLSFDARFADVPGFRSRFYFLGWRLGIVRRRSIRWHAGARLGSFTMRFDADSLPDYRRSENELGTELASQVGWLPVPSWELSFSGRYRTILTEPRIRHVNLAVSLTRDFRTPRWLRDFLD